MNNHRDSSSIQAVEFFLVCAEVLELCHALAAGEPSIPTASLSQASHFLCPDRGRLSDIPPVTRQERDLF